MKITRSAFMGSAAGLAGIVALAAYAQTPTPAVAIDPDDIGGVVRGANGQPEAGVWVIAETRDLPVRYVKIVVTDDQGRFVLPDLPEANYVWARGTAHRFDKSNRARGRR